jgi:hypothetical protein
MSWADDNWPGEHGWCDDPPMVARYQPPPGVVGTQDPVQFLIQIPTAATVPPIERVSIVARYLSGRAEGVFRNGAFLPLYRPSSREIDSTDPAYSGWAFSLLRVAPWPETFSLEVAAETPSGLPLVLGGGPVPGTSTEVIINES